MSHSTSFSLLLFGIVISFELQPASAETEHRSSYYKDGEIHVNVLGTPEENH